MRRVKLLLFVFGWTVAAAAATLLGEWCQGGLGVVAYDPYAPEMGTRDAIRSTKDQDVYRVATGLETEIYRTIPKDPAKPSYGFKTYQDTIKYALEVQGYRVLEDVYGPGQPSTADAFDVLRVDVASVPNFLFTGDVRGKSLPKVLADPHVDPKIKEALRESYRKGLADLDRRMEKVPRDGREEGTQDDLPTLAYLGVKRKQSVTRLSIRASQIVVSFAPGNPYSFRLTLVDPL